jgi:hypothetical protein
MAPRYGMYGMPPDPRPLKGTPEAIIREELDRLTGLDPAPEALEPETPETAQPISIESASAPIVKEHRATPRFGKKSPSPQQSLPDRKRHARKCSICHHREREAIDSAFLHWHNSASIVYNFQVSERTLYRHAVATGLYHQRQRNFRCALEGILERGDTVRLTATGFVAAVRAYACIDDAGQWHEPSKHSIVTNQYVDVRSVREPATSSAQTPISEFSNQQIPQLETGPTDSK